MAAVRQGPAVTVRLLGDRNFAPYFAGNLCSNCGTWFQTLAQAILVYRLTGSSFWLGMIAFAQFAGVVVLAPWSGSAADRFDRRRLLICTQLGATAVTSGLAALVFLDLATLEIVVGFALALGAVQAFTTPAAQALVPSLVETDRLASAIALNSTAFNLARAVGPSAAALVIAHFGLEWAFALNSGSYLLLVAALLVVRPLRPQRRPDRRPRLRDSIALVRRRPELAALLGVTAALSVAIDPVNTLSPAFASDVYGRSDTLAGYLIGAFGAGAVTAAFTVAGRAGSLRRQLTVRLALLGAGIVAFGLAPSLVAAFAALVVAGFGYLAANTAANTRLQLGVDEGERGRIMALWAICFLGVRPFGSLVDGALASAIGLRAAAVVLALPALAAVGTIVLVGRRRREEGLP